MSEGQEPRQDKEKAYSLDDFQQKSSIKDGVEQLHNVEEGGAIIVEVKPAFSINIISDLIPKEASGSIFRGKFIKDKERFIFVYDENLNSNMDVRISRYFGAISPHKFVEIISRKITEVL